MKIFCFLHQRKCLHQSFFLFFLQEKQKEINVAIDVAVELAKYFYTIKCWRVVWYFKEGGVVLRRTCKVFLYDFLYYLMIVVM